MRTEQELVDKKVELSIRRDNIRKKQDELTGRQQGERQMSAFALYRLSDMIDALDWVLGENKEL